MKKWLFFVLVLCLSPPLWAATYPITPNVITAAGSGAASDATPIAQAQVAGYSWVTVQLYGTWSGTVTFEVSNDPTNAGWTPVSLINTSASAGGASPTATANGSYTGPKGAAVFFRARVSTYTSGTVQAVASFSANPSGWQAKGDNSNTCTGSVTSIDVDGGTTGYSFTGGPITTGGTLTMEGNPAFTNVVTTYNSISTVKGGLPAIYAAVDLTAQTAAIAATTMLTTAADGLYRVSYVAKLTTVASTSSTLGGATGFQVKYTDVDDNVVVTTAAGSTSALNTTQAQVNGVIVVHAKNSTDIQYLMGYISNSAAEMVYSLHIEVEAL